MMRSQKFTQGAMRLLVCLPLLAIFISACVPPPPPPPDSDKDGIVNSKDNCKQVANADNQADFDGDGRGDVCDGPAWPAAGDEYMDDFDNDGWDTATDYCPTDYDTLNDPDTCTDDDGDTVANAVDNCPTRKNQSQDHEVCNDPDGDGYYNAADDDGLGLDNCTTRANASQNPDVCDDSDGDNLYLAAPDDNPSETLDNCPAVSSTDVTDTNSDGEGDVCDNDDDGDGILDADDNSFGTTDGACRLNPDPDCNADNSMTCIDLDVDGIYDAGSDAECGGPVDNCPTKKNATQNALVCTDSDGDGVYEAADDDGSAVDNCPSRANATQNADVCDDTDGDGVYTAAADGEAASAADTCPTVYDESNDPQSCACSPQMIEVTYDLRATWSAVSGTPLGAGDNDHQTFGARVADMRAALRFVDVNGNGAVDDNGAQVELVYLYTNQDFTTENSGLTVVTYFDNQTADARRTVELDSSELNAGSATGTYDAATGNITWDGLGVNSTYEAVEANLDDYQRIGTITCSGGGFFVTCGSVTEVNCTGSPGECVDRLALKNTKFNNTTSPYFYALSRTSNTSTGDANADTRMTSDTAEVGGAGTAAPSFDVIPDNGFCD